MNSDDYFIEQMDADLEITAESDITMDEAFERQIPYAVSKARSTLRLVNRLLAERGLEIAALDADLGSEIAFIIREKV